MSERGSELVPLGPEEGVVDISSQTDLDPYQEDATFEFRLHGPKLSGFCSVGFVNPEVYVSGRLLNGIIRRTNQILGVGDQTLVPDEVGSDADFDIQSHALMASIKELRDAIQHLRLDERKVKITIFQVK